MQNIQKSIFYSYSLKLRKKKFWKFFQFFIFLVFSKKISRTSFLRHIHWPKQYWVLGITQKPKWRKKNLKTFLNLFSKKKIIFSKLSKFDFLQKKCISLCFDNKLTNVILQNMVWNTHKFHPTLVTSVIKHHVVLKVKFYGKKYVCVTRFEN